MNDVAENQKQAAVDQHSRQAEEFAERYRDMNAATKPSCFIYSRKRLDGWPIGSFLRTARDDACWTSVAALGTTWPRFARGFEVAGVDGSPDMLEHARLNPGVEVHQTDVDHLPFADASLDFIVCVEVLRYVPEWSASLREIAQLLKPGGVALVTAAPLFSVNGYALVNRLALFLPAGRLVRLKQFFTTAAGLRRQFQTAGFGTVNIHGVYSGPINWIERLGPRRLHRR